MLGVGEIAGRVVGGVLCAADAGGAVDRVWPAGLDTAERVVLIAAGKGSVGMTRAAVARLGGRLARGVVVGPDRHVDAWADRPGSVEALGADHPIPTARNVEAAERVRMMAGGARAGETLLVLISGGASAYLTLPSAGLGLGDLASVTDALVRAGATIRELNAVRKHCELLKGGGLARAGSGAGGVCSIVLSDVLGDPLDVIGSGPTAGDTGTFGDALGVLEGHGALGVSPAVRARLERGVRGEIDETLGPDDPVIARVRHVIAANNAVAVGAAAGVMRGLGFEVVETRLGVEGEAGVAGRALGERVRALAGGGGGARCVVWGGETTVAVGDSKRDGGGAGGRVQEAVLAACVGVEGVSGAGVIGLATDGVDGPTDAAGAWADARTAEAMRDAGVDPSAALRRHDSYTALDRVDALLRTGPTGTNVNDVLVGFLTPGG